MKACVLLSGGKDSNHALYTLLKEGAEITCIVVVHPRREDSWMFHAVNTWAATLQAEAMGYKDRTYNVEVSGVKEKEMEELEKALAEIRDTTGFDTIVAGIIASRYQKSRVEKIAEKLGVNVHTPLWNVDPEEYMRRLVMEGFKFMVTSITVMGLPFELLGKPIGLREVEEIIGLARKHHFNPAFEGGEAETLVYSAPHYRKVLCVKGRRLRIREFEYKVVIEDAWLEDEGIDCMHLE